MVAPKIRMNNPRHSNTKVNLLSSLLDSSLKESQSFECSNDCHHCRDTTFRVVTENEYRKIENGIIIKAVNHPKVFFRLNTPLRF